MHEESESRYISEFMGEMREWKRSLDKTLADSFTSFSNRLDGFVTVKEFLSHKEKVEHQQKQIDDLKKKVSRLTWAFVALFALVLCGELAIHKLSWVMALFGIA